VAVQRVQAGGQVERIPLLAKPVDVQVRPGLAGGWALVQALAGLFLAVGMGWGFLPSSVWKRFTAARRI
jgi:hypothetical protein